jgi:hypothetical protein
MFATNTTMFSQQRKNKQSSFTRRLWIWDMKFMVSLSRLGGVVVGVLANVPKVRILNSFSRE